MRFVLAKVAHICGRILNEDADGALTATEEILSGGKGVGVLVKDMLEFLRDCAIVKVCKTAREIINLPDETYKKIEETAAAADGHKILRVTEILAKAETDMRYSTSGRITLETAVFKASTPLSDYNIDALIGRINALERSISGGVAIKPAPEAVKIPTAPPTESVPCPKPKIELKEEAAQGDPFAQKAEPKPVETPAVQGGANKNTLCMDLDHAFEGEKLVFITDSEAVLKSLNRPDNANFIASVLAELGVTDYEVRLKAKGESEYEKALRELKTNFDGIDVKEK